MPSWKGWAVLSIALYLPSAANVAAPSQSAKLSVATGDPASVVKEVFMIPTRDGMLLKTILFRLPSVKGPGPVVLLRAPLNQERYEAQARPFAAAGYYAVTQDSRGRFGSEGKYPFYSGEGQDSYDTIEWIRKQPWCNGKVGMWGHSNPGTVTWMTAAEGVPLDAWPSDAAR